MPPFMVSMESFSPIFATIDFPEDWYFYRGYDPRHPAIGRRPAYYTSQVGIAKSYADQFNTRVGLFKTTKPLRIYDLRFIKHLLMEMLEQRARPTTPQLRASIMTATLSYGIGSFQNQIELAKQRYSTQLTKERFQAMERHLKTCKNHRGPTWANPVEAQGIRIAETNNDAEAIIVLKAIFGSCIDGYIAPKLHSPYHTEKSDGMMNSEIVIFDPVDAGIEYVPDDQAPPNIPQTSVNLLLSQDRPLHIYSLGEPIGIYNGGGASKHKNETVHDYHPNEFFDRVSDRWMKCREARAQALAWHLRINTHEDDVCPPPQHEITPWKLD